MKELEILLDHYWITKLSDKVLFYQVKDSIPKFKNFLSDKLGYGLVVNQYLIKLEKIPGSAQPFMGIKDFSHKLEYVLLCQLLMFLEDRARNDQFVLSELTEFISANQVGREKIDWTLYSHRKHFIKVLNLARELELVQIDDGDDQKFARDDTTEVLYASTGLSRYFMRHFTTDMMAFKGWQDFENAEWGDLDGDRGLIRRHRVYRRLAMEPVVYARGSDDADYDYIKKQRGLLENDFSNFLEYPLHVHKNGALLMVPADKNSQDTFPNSRTISDITLLFCGLIQKYLRQNKVRLNSDGGIILSKAAFEALVESLKKSQGQNWSKEYREISLSGLVGQLLEYMEEFGMLRRLLGDREIEILPLAGKMAGEYPDEGE